MGIDARMFVRVPRILTCESVRRVAVAMQTAFGDDILDVIRPGRYRYAPSGQHSLTIVDRWEQDGPDIEPAPDETFVEVHLASRYYGPGYERGNLVGILSVADYLSTVFAPCSVWYGGDSSGVCARPLDAEYRAELWRHFCSPGSRDYFTGRTSRMGEDAVRCDFCGIDAVAYMFSAERTGHRCSSCSGQWLRYRSGAVVECNEKNEPLAVVS